MRDVIREANGLDMARYTTMQERSERTMSVAREETRQNKIDLKIISAEFTLDGNMPSWCAPETQAKRNWRHCAGVWRSV